MASSGDNPERLLSNALRAQATGGPAPESHAAAGSATALRAPGPGRQRLPVLGLLLFALVLGVLAGTLAGVLSIW